MPKTVEYGTSSNTLYVTGANVAATGEPETIYKLGSEAAKGKKPETDAGNDVLNAIWAKFATRDIKNMKGNTLKYWGGGQQTKGSGDNAATLIKTADGKCGDWVNLFQRVTFIQGAGSAPVEVLPTHWTSAPDPAWPNGPYRIRTVPKARFNGDDLKVRLLIVKDQKAQGSGDQMAPVSEFENHALALRQTGPTQFTLFDPSYGTKITGVTPDEVYLAWETTKTFSSAVPNTSTMLRPSGPH